MSVGVDSPYLGIFPHIEDLLSRTFTSGVSFICFLELQSGQAIYSLRMSIAKWWKKPLATYSMFSAQKSLGSWTTACRRPCVFVHVFLRTMYVLLGHVWGGVGYGNNVHVARSCYGVIITCGHALDPTAHDLLLRLHTHLTLRHETTLETASS